MKNTRYSLLVLILLVLLSACETGDKGIDLRKKSGIVIIEDFNGIPDSLGILKEIPLDFPAFSKGGYFAGDGGGQSYLPGNRNHLWLFDNSYRVLNEPVNGPRAPYYLMKSPPGRQGSFTILQLPDDRYLCMLPLAGSYSLSWIEFEEGYAPVLKSGSLGKAPVTTTLPLLAWASFSPDPQKFPWGWEKVMSMKDSGHIKWMGLWHHQSGYFNGMAGVNDFGKLNDHLTSVKSGAYLSEPNKESIDIFYRQLFGSVKQAGFDFTKVDFQSSNFLHYIGENNAVHAHGLVSGSMEASVHRLGLDLLNCIAQDMVSVLNTQYSNVTRCSQDYRKGNLSNARIHIYQSYNNLLWMGHTVWGDHDMFHSSDRVCGRLMAVSKAMSGGPVYLSDHPDHFLAEYVGPLCYGDGEIIRPLAPAVPLPESVFNNPMHEKVSYRVIAPLPNQAAAVVCYNLYESETPEELESTVRATDYRHASALLQPYPGPREMPAEGLIIYDWYGEKIIPGNEHHFALSGLSDGLFHLCPVEHGVAVIGRTDKYLSPATVSEIQVKTGSPGNKILSFTMKESGPFAICLDMGIPEAGKINFEAKENGLWIAIPPQGILN